MLVGCVCWLAVLTVGALQPMCHNLRTGHTVLIIGLCSPPPPLPLPPVLRRAELSSEVQSWAEEVALDEQGHVRMVRQVRSLCVKALPSDACC